MMVETAGRAVGSAFGRWWCRQSDDQLPLNLSPESQGKDSPIPCSRELFREFGTLLSQCGQQVPLKLAIREIFSVLLLLRQGNFRDAAGMRAERAGIFGLALSARMNARSSTQRHGHLELPRETSTLAVARRF